MDAASEIITSSYLTLNKLKESKLPINLKSDNGQVITIFSKIGTFTNQQYQVIMKNSPYPFLMTEEEVGELLHKYKVM